ncbi:DUF2147 domain-containing protein [Methylorubrum thiocyanatum]|uniref:DUF2147 domain-containing protein n=1 Tax=Methylorubrum thiocyanatum TaxID=47958 RepID=UPI00383B3513
MNASSTFSGSLGMCLVGALLTVTAIGGVAQAAPIDPTGTWQIHDDTARIRIEKCGSEGQNICGYPVWLKTGVNANGLPRLDGNNPDPTKRSRLVLGHQNILGMKPNAEGKYEGRIYNVENGRTYDITAAVVPAHPSQLVIHACVMVVMCENLIWKRVADILPGQLTGPTDGPDGPRADPEWAPVAGTPLGRRTTGTPSRR